MVTSILSLTLVSAALAADPLTADTHLSFKGTVAELKADRTPGDAQKTFELHLFVAERGEDSAKLFWLVDENGRGRWPWPERFGTVSLDAKLKASGTGPTLLYDRGEGTSIIPLMIPLLTRPDGKPLRVDAQWEEEADSRDRRGPLEFHVQKAEKRDGRNVWQVEVSNNFGRYRTLWVDQGGPTVVALEQRVFMGMGEEYQLALKLVESKRLTGAEQIAAIKGTAALVALRSKLKFPPRSEEFRWDAKQLALLQKKIPQAEELATTGPVAKLVKAARRDLVTQSDRSGALEKLAAKVQGEPAAKFRLTGLAGKALSNDDLKGQITVLHFWDYNDAPLKQPYGQVGYLDFLYGKRKAEGLKVYGVATDRRLNDLRTRDAAVRSVRRLAKFMNLSYPILLDDGRAIKAFGDPRPLGAKLPLFVVIGPDGKIAHYKVGYYNVDRLAGLKELNQVVEKLVKEKE